MIIANGYIKTKNKVGGGLDSSGYPTAPFVSWSEPIACQYRSIRQNFQAKDNGTPYVDVSYEILIEAMPFMADRLALFDCHNNEVGEYSILSVEPLMAVCMLRLTV